MMDGGCTGFFFCAGVHVCLCVCDILPEVCVRVFLSQLESILCRCVCAHAAGVCL